MDEMNVLELFCGIGGMHFALRGTGIQYTVEAAVDINTVTNSVYRHNFPDVKLLQREIQSLTVEELMKMNINTITMSPPCQPFTRVGLKKDDHDNRTNAFLSLLTKILQMENPPAYIFVENVQGFDSSSTRETLLKFFAQLHYDYREFLLTPLQFAVPNSRLRYYCMARHKSIPEFKFGTKHQMLTGIPVEIRQYLLNSYIENEQLNSLIKESHSTDGVTEPLSFTERIDLIPELNPLSSYLQQEAESADGVTLSSDHMKYYEALDIRYPHSKNSCCFTKRYGHYFTGSGSVIPTGKILPDSNLPELRLFTSREIANLMNFPTDFSFPDCVTIKQRYKSLGNSLNVLVVSNLMNIMFSPNT